MAYILGFHWILVHSHGLKAFEEAHADPRIKVQVLKFRMRSSKTPSQNDLLRPSLDGTRTGENSLGL